MSGSERRRPARAAARGGRPGRPAVLRPAHGAATRGRRPPVAGEDGSVVALVFCETADDLAAVHRTLDAMSPGEVAGRRASVEMFEVVLDEQLR